MLEDQLRAVGWLVGSGCTCVGSKIRIRDVLTESNFLTVVTGGVGKSRECVPPLLLNWGSACRVRPVLSETVEFLAVGVENRDSI